LIGIPNTALHRFVADSIGLCNPDSVFVCTDTEEDLEYIRRQTVESGEEIPLSVPGHTCHFDGTTDQGREREVTKYLVPRGDSLSKALNQVEREEGLMGVWIRFPPRLRSKYRAGQE
jgi:phosphoenolpyruvate carboxykinase (GTP)